MQVGHRYSRRNGAFYFRTPPRVPLRSSRRNLRSPRNSSKVLRNRVTSYSHNASSLTGSPNRITEQYRTLGAIPIIRSFQASSHSCCHSRPLHHTQALRRSYRSILQRLGPRLDSRADGSGSHSHTRASYRNHNARP